MIRRRTLGGRQAPWPPRRSRQAARAGTPPPRPDYAGPASVTAAFFVAWASVDTVHDTPGSFAARCAPLSTPALERQLAGSQPPTAAWQQMRAARMVSLVQVRAVTCPDGGPTPTASAAYLRVYATWVTVTASGRTTASDGVTLRLADMGGSWSRPAPLAWPPRLNHPTTPGGIA
jgi:hypothetical protein